MTDLVIEHLGFGDEAVEYLPTWDFQKSLHAEVVAGQRPDTLLLLEHVSVYTAGRRTEAFERPFDDTEVVDVDRGGKITWHGPGQLVGYPIMRLDSPMNVVPHVRRIEEMVIRVCADLGVTTSQVTGRSGVWLDADDRGPARKVCAIGVRVAQGVTMHGFAINCDNDLTYFDRIVPCGITDAAVTSLSRELKRDVSVEEVRSLVENHAGMMKPW